MIVATVYDVSYDCTRDHEFVTVRELEQWVDTYCDGHTQLTHYVTEDGVTHVNEDVMWCDADTGVTVTKDNVLLYLEGCAG